MPQLEVTASALVKESPKDETPTGDVSVSFKDGSVDDYNGPIRLKVAKSTSRTIDVAHLSSLRVLAIKLLSGDSFRLALRKTSSESTDLLVKRFFFAELCNVEQIKLTANEKTDVEVQVQLVSIKQS